MMRGGSPPDSNGAGGTAGRCQHGQCAAGFDGELLDRSHPIGDIKEAVTQTAGGRDGYARRGYLTDGLQLPVRFNSEPEDLLNRDQRADVDEIGHDGWDYSTG